MKITSTLILIWNENKGVDNGDDEVSDGSSPPPQWGSRRVDVTLRKVKTALPDSAHHRFPPHFLAHIWGVASP